MEPAWLKSLSRTASQKKDSVVTFSATVVTGFLESGRVVFKPAPAGDFIRNNPFKKRTWRKANKTETKDK
jgi:hypothetical protein